MFQNLYSVSNRRKLLPLFFVIQLCILSEFQTYAQSVTDIPVIECADFSDSFDPAYLSNGMIGTRPGANPLAEGRSTVVCGYVRNCEWEPFEMTAKAPYPFLTEIIAGGASSLQTPDAIKVVSQKMDMNNGELTSVLEFHISSEAIYKVEVLQFIPLNLPAVVCQKVKITPNFDTGFEIHARVKQGLHEQRNKLGVAVMGNASQGFSLKKGESTEFVTIVAMVSEFYHPDPYLQAKRVAGWAQMLGFDKIREKNRQAWRELWKSRIKIIGSPEDQKGVDAAFYYVHSSISPFNMTGVAPYGLSHDSGYFGHGFWDMDHWVFHSILMSSPDSARAMMEYRWNNLDAARKKTALFGFKGLMFSWESATDGSEATPSTANTGWAEHHVIPGVGLAFWEYYLTTGDEEFLTTRAWPVLRGCAEWIASRGEFTSRGFEIKNILGVDENVPNIDNNAHMNILCRTMMAAAIRCAQKVQFNAPMEWQKIIDTMYIPVDPNKNAVIPYDGVKVYPKAKGYSIGAAQFLVFHDPLISMDLLESTFKYEESLREMMDPAPNCPCSKGAVGFPCPTLATGAAMFGDREKAAELFRISWKNYTLEPYMTAKEYPGHSDGNFLTNQGAQLEAVIYGFTGLRLNEKDICKYAATLPADWERIEIDRLWLKGKAYKLVAEHGKKANLIELR